MHTLIFKESTCNRLFKELIWLSCSSRDKGIKIGKESKSEGGREKAKGCSLICVCV